MTLMPRAIATARDALLNDRRKSAAHSERPAEQVLALATEPRACLYSKSTCKKPRRSPAIHRQLSLSCRDTVFRVSMYHCGASVNHMHAHGNTCRGWEGARIVGV